MRKPIAAIALLTIGALAAPSAASADAPTFKQQCTTLGGEVARTVYNGSGYDHSGHLGLLKDDFAEETLYDGTTPVGTKITAKTIAGTKIKLTKIVQNGSTTIDPANSRDFFYVTDQLSVAKAALCIVPNP